MGFSLMRACAVWVGVTHCKRCIRRYAGVTENQCLSRSITRNMIVVCGPMRAKLGTNPAQAATTTTHHTLAAWSAGRSPFHKDRTPSARTLFRRQSNVDEYTVPARVFRIVICVMHRVHECTHLAHRGRKAGSSFETARARDVTSHACRHRGARARAPCNLDDVSWR